MSAVAALASSAATALPAAPAHIEQQVQHPHKPRPVGACRHLRRSQRRVLHQAVDTADDLHAPRRARVALIAAGWVESHLRNLAWGDADSEGFLQVRVGIHGRRIARSVRRSSAVFLHRGFTGAGGAIYLARRTFLSSGRIAQVVQGSAYPHRYGQASGYARRLIRCTA